MSWKLKRTKQCAKCPWRKTTNPREIPDGYSEEKHRRLEATIARPGDLSLLDGRDLTAMACHEHGDTHCIGWLVQQAGRGNNLALRIALMSCENGGQVETVGPQHQTFEDTLPRD